MQNAVAWLMLSYWVRLTFAFTRKAEQYRELKGLNDHCWVSFHRNFWRHHPRANLAQVGCLERAVEETRSSHWTCQPKVGTGLSTRARIERYIAISGKGLASVFHYPLTNSRPILLVGLQAHMGITSVTISEFL